MRYHEQLHHCRCSKACQPLNPKLFVGPGACSGNGSQASIVLIFGLRHHNLDPLNPKPVSPLESSQHTVHTISFHDGDVDATFIRPELTAETAATVFCIEINIGQSFEEPLATGDIF